MIQLNIHHDVIIRDLSEKNRKSEYDDRNV